MCVQTFFCILMKEWWVIFLFDIMFCMHVLTLKIKQWQQFFKKWPDLMYLCNHAQGDFLVLLSSCSKGQDSKKFVTCYDVSEPWHLNKIMCRPELIDLEYFVSPIRSKITINFIKSNLLPRGNVQVGTNISPSLFFYLTSIWISHIDKVIILLYIHYTSYYIYYICIIILLYIVYNKSCPSTMLSEFTLK